MNPASAGSVEGGGELDDLVLLPPRQGGHFLEHLAELAGRAAGPVGPDDGAPAEPVARPPEADGRWARFWHYDAADRLRQVDKRAADGVTGQRRVFDYNAAGWLTAVQLPEYADQKMRYAYDDLGNVTAKELVSAMYGSPLGYAETLAYDALSRLTARTVTFSDRLVHHTFTYDGGAVAAPPAGHPGDFAWGRLTHDRTTYGLDPGAVAVERFVRYNWQGLPEEKAERFGTLVDEDTVAGEEFVTAYPAYDRQGNLRAMTYPSGQAVAWEYQDGGTLREVGDGTRAIFSNLAYAAHGAVAGMQLGDAATGQAGWGQAFDPARLWPVRIVAGTTAVTANTSTASGAVLFGLDYDNYEANGNIAAVTRTLRTGAYGTPYTMDFGYSYDRLNRLAGCAVADAVYTYAMDEFGNILGRAVTGGGGELPSSLALVVSRATNRLGGAGYYHDVLGNLVTMPAADGVGTVSMTYLDQGHIGTLTDAAGVAWKYYYDADGKRRIKVKTAGGAATEPDGHGGVRLVADRSYYFYEGENLICQQDIGALVQDESQYEPKFLLLDHLGSTRAELVFDPSTLAPQIQEYYDLMPYGEVIDPPTTQESVLFTGKPKDTESGLDEFGPRKFSSSLCRWISSDVLFTKKRIGNPQTWNLYTYCADNPTKFTDPTGLWQVSQVEDTDKKGKKSIQLRIVQSNKDDTASGLAKQLGFADNKKLINKIEGMLQKDSSGINGKDLPGIIGRTFKVAEKGLTAQASFIQQPGGDPGPNVPRMMDCSMTSAQIAFPSAMQGVFSNGQWGTHSTNVMISNSQLQTVQSGGERVGDLVRWGEGRGLHFANVLFINDDGNVDVFSRSGNRGRFEIVGINDDIGYGTNYSIFRPKE